MYRLFRKEVGLLLIRSSKRREKMSTRLLRDSRGKAYYPSLCIEHKLLSRTSKTPEKFEDIYRKRLALKAEGKKKEQAPYKIVLDC